ncbi:hypothetical protein MZO42_15560 [Sphingomonas psychrotolerans]|uniref:Uncharacterized protein n=1 Tax=Sphingomonas psychrotolerans TaxID=1327635 RepID=A0ABU3N6J4_9SPHN|nr:hypothetical protein [Sphingomonas psychrotolerans]MDT8760117.1 hypothetical protein [Sphingomonas psychrotolerans]
MKKFTLMLAGLGIAAAALPATAIAAPAPHFASYQAGWQNINARQARLDARIDQGIRSGALSRSEAVRLKVQFRELARLEARYRASRPGLTLAERRDLDRRFDALSARIRIEKHDRNGRRGW